MKTISISGASGFVGQNIKKFFEAKGYEVICIKRDELKDIETLTFIIGKTDFLVNLSGANIIGRWSEEYKKLLYSSRIETTKALVNAINNASHKPELFISTSAVGIYKNGKCYDEDEKELNDDFLADLCKEWEKQALKAHDIKVAIFRFGIVLGDGGALKKMLPAFKLGLGGRIGSGKQYFSYIHIQDLLNAYEFLFKHENLHGIFNLTAPEITTNSEFTKVLGKALKRPTIFPLPEFALKLIFSEGAKVLTDGQCAKPKRLLENGFKFEFKNICDAIEDLVG